MFANILRATSKIGVLSSSCTPKLVVAAPRLVSASSFHSSGGAVRGFEEFYDVTKGPNDVVASGRAWTVSDLRRKDFDDLHKLWWVLYKERNLLLTLKEKVRRTQRPYTAAEEARYTKVKRSMAAIKHVMSERRKIGNLIAKEEAEAASAKA